MDVEVGKADDRLAAAMTPAAGADLARPPPRSRQRRGARLHTAGDRRRVKSGERASLLFAAVRDKVWYDPLLGVPRPCALPGQLRARGRPRLLRAQGGAAGRGAAGRRRPYAAGLRRRAEPRAVRRPARAVVGGTDLFVQHGYCSVHLDGRWLKATPAFNVELCDRFVVPGRFRRSERRAHARVHVRRHPAHGVRADPRQLRRPPSGPDPDRPRPTYGRVAPGAGVADHAFVAPVDTGEASQHAPVDPSGSIRLSTSTMLLLTSEVAR